MKNIPLNQSLYSVSQNQHLVIKMNFANDLRLKYVCLRSSPLVTHYLHQNAFCYCFLGRIQLFHLKLMHAYSWYLELQSWDRSIHFPLLKLPTACTLRFGIITHPEWANHYWRTKSWRSPWSRAFSSQSVHLPIYCCWQAQKQQEQAPTAMD